MKPVRPTLKSLSLIAAPPQERGPSAPANSKAQHPGALRFLLEAGLHHRPIPIFSKLLALAASLQALHRTAAENNVLTDKREARLANEVRGGERHDGLRSLSARLVTTAASSGGSSDSSAARTIASLTKHGGISISTYCFTTASSSAWWWWKASSQCVGVESAHSSLQSGTFPHKIRVVKAYPAATARESETNSIVATVWRQLVPHRQPARCPELPSGSARRSANTGG